MFRSLSICLALAVGSVSATALAASDPILVRQKIMKSNGAAAKPAGAMLKGEMEFDAVVANAAIRTMNAVAYTFDHFFPAGSETGMKTTASPKIWQDMDGFKAKLAQFQKDTDAAAAAEPKDLEAFKAVMGPVFKNCKGCHEDYRIKKDK